MNDENCRTLQSQSTNNTISNKNAIGSDKTIATVKSLWQDAITVESSPNVTIKAIPQNNIATIVTTISPNQRRITNLGDKIKDDSSIDFEIGNIIGRGGMGAVYTARQASLNRQIAVKVMDKGGSDSSVNSFLEEAVITGNLDHPNIVPVYDLGSTGDGAVFYAMKEISGSSWDQSITTNSLAHNLRILFSVCDAVAFAHSKNIIHRDIKPENVMLGKFGETLLVDWGIAIVTDKDSAKQTGSNTSLSGTPAYMSPEMASCNFDKISMATDIYLLGGVLYEITTGLKPHTGINIFGTISAAMENSIQPTDKCGELIDIALKAMSSEPEDRYQTVKELQNAIRKYQQHTESMVISNACQLRYNNISNTINDNTYRELTEIIAGFQQALQLWDENYNARDGIYKTRIKFITTAMEHGDLMLAQSQLTAIDSDSKSYVLNSEIAVKIKQLTKELKAAIAHARAKTRLIRFSVTVAVLGAISTLAITYSAYLITGKERDNAIVAKEKEVIHRKNAQEALVTAQNATYFNQIALANSYLEKFMPSHAENLLEATPARLRDWEWGYLAHLCRRPLMTIKSDLQMPSHIAFSPDGKNIATVDSAETINIWDSFTGKQITTLRASSLGGISDIVFSSNSHDIILVTHDGGIRTWNIREAKELLYIKPKLYPKNILATAFSSDGKMFAGIARDGKVYTCSTKTSTLTESPTLTPNPPAINSIAIANSGDTIACGSDDSILHIYDIKTGKLLRKLISPTKLPPVISVAFSPNENHLAIGTSSRLIQIWDINAETPCITASGHNLDVAAIAFSADGNRLASTGSDGLINIWDAHLTTDFLKLKFQENTVQSLKYSPDGKTVATIGIDDTVIILNSSNWKEQQSLSGHTKPITSIDYSSDGKQLITASSDRTAKLWDIDNGETVLEFKHTAPLTSAIFSSDSKQILTTDNATAQLWRTKDGKRLALLKGKLGNFKTAAFSPDGKQMLTAGNNLTLWDTKTGKKIHHIKSAESDITCATFSPNGKKIITGDQTGATIWDATTAKELFTLQGHAGAVICVAFSPNSKRVITGSLHSSFLWDTNTGKELLALPHDNGWTTAITFSPDSSQLLMGHSNGTITLKPAVYINDNSKLINNNMQQSLYSMWLRSHTTTQSREYFNKR